MLLAVVGFSGGPAVASTKHEVPNAQLAGKTVLLIPYWLDNFGIGFTHWMTALLKAEGVTATTINPNAVASAELSAITTELASHKYSAIVWEPIDENAAATTVKQLQAAKIPQVVFQGVQNGQWSAPDVNLDETHSLTNAGVIAATYIKSHPSLGSAPLAAFMGVYPQNTACIERMNSLLDGMRSVMPNAKVVYFGSADGEADATTKMTDFIDTHKAFNVTDGCGSASTLGVVNALNAAGMATAVNKVPQKIFVMTQDGTPPELQYLWNKDSALMVSSLLPPKTIAQQTLPLVNGLLQGTIALGSSVTVNVGWSPLTPDCAKYRPDVLQQFAGVKGFTVPQCSFTYTGPVTWPIS
ncbi:MAG TPA: substrate-binding domain-containing protein [Acidimicrobiales bacterium]|nr:substrate-binding domain-containing protein [Acidimicrobiales bacterium]